MPNKKYNWRTASDKDDTIFIKMTRIEWAIRFEIVRTLIETKGNKSVACKLLGCSRETLFRHIHNFNIELYEYKLDNRIIIINVKQMVINFLKP